MESEIGEANTQIIIFGWRDNCLMGISCGLLNNESEKWYAVS